MIDELIIADDGSHEKVMDFISDLLEQCPFTVKHVIQEDLGFRLARSRNNAVRVAEGDFLIFVDQDLILPNDFVEKLYRNRKRKRMVFSRAVVSGEEEKNKILPYLKLGYSYDELYPFVKDMKVRDQVFHDHIYTIFYFLKLRTRGAKIAGLIFSLYKEDYISINGFDEKYIGWGEEDDDLGNRFFKYGGNTKVIPFEKYPIHLFHSFEKSKAERPNRVYYLQRKKEINRKNYRCEYGYDNTLGEDQFQSILLKK